MYAFINMRIFICNIFKNFFNCYFKLIYISFLILVFNLNFNFNINLKFKVIFYINLKFLFKFNLIFYINFKIIILFDHKNNTNSNTNAL